ncbi:Replication factor A protein 1 [Sticta canariensis]|nr:Replication factor A protein 1 [Sticta canariensis]
MEEGLPYQASHVNRGALRLIFGNPEGAAPEPVLQCVQIKPLAGQQGSVERFRVVLSDIDSFVQCMLATQVCHVVHEGKLRKGCFVRLKSFQANEVKGKKYGPSTVCIHTVVDMSGRILIVLGLDVLEELGECEKLGEPKTLEIKDEETKPQSTTIASNGFYGIKPEEKPAQQSLTSRSSQSYSRHATIYPIEALSPYAHKWTIKARCTSKSEIKTWHNKNGEGKLFTVNLLDDSGEIRATAFKEQCDAFYNIFQEGGVYYISAPCRVQMAKKQFSNLSNDYELTFETGTLVEKADEQSGVPQVRFNFTNIGDLQSVEKDSTIDVIGILKEVSDTNQVVSKTTNKPYDKRELTLVDNTGFSVRLTIWGNTATNFDAALESVIAFKGVKVSDFGGRSLSLLSSGSMAVHPDIDESHRLKGWYEGQGKDGAFATHASMGGTMGAAGGLGDPLKSILQVKEENLGMSETTDYFTIKATIIYIKQENFSYPACLSPDCNKKVVEEEPGQWVCARCEKTHPKAQYRYVMSFNVSDHTGQIWLSCFDDVGRMVMGMSADQLNELKENGDNAGEETFQEANCTTWLFKCRAKMDNFQDQQR